MSSLFRIQIIGLVAFTLLSVACDKGTPDVSEATANTASFHPNVRHSVAPSGWFEPAYSESHTSRDGRLLFWTVAGTPRYTTDDGGTWQNASVFPFATGGATKILAHPLYFLRRHRQRTIERSKETR